MVGKKSASRSMLRENRAISMLPMLRSHPPSVPSFVALELLVAHLERLVHRALRALGGSLRVRPDLAAPGELLEAADRILVADVEDAGRRDRVRQALGRNDGRGEDEEQQRRDRRCATRKK
jgi:hypothetical protein